jgi:endonuclease YncB( thermonuclease family)
MMRAVLIAAAFVVASGVAIAQDIAGRASAVQADQISFGVRRISLFGVDAPDLDQDRECLAKGVRYGCGTNAKRALEILVDLGPAACIDSGQKNFIGIPYMTCTVNGQDIGAELVRQGWAVAFLPQSDKYKNLEAEAKAAKRGLWQDGIVFTLPWVWRERDGKPILGP